MSIRSSWPSNHLIGFDRVAAHSCTGSKAEDPRAVVAVLALLGTIAILAAAGPLRRAASTDIMVTLRAD
jgi:hypothetical protein